MIIDEIGYIPIDRQGANLSFQLISGCYEKGAIILTSNQSLRAWGVVFGDSVIVAAILDGLLHHSITVNIRGDSYRLKEKRKAVLLKSKLRRPMRRKKPGLNGPRNDDRKGVGPKGHTEIRKNTRQRGILNDQKGAVF